MELELVLEEELLEFVRELAAEDATEDTDKQEKRGEAATHLEPSTERPPAGTTQCIMGMNTSAPTIP
jgi:hypothetical protein